MWVVFQVLATWNGVVVDIHGRVSLQEDGESFGYTPKAVSLCLVVDQILTFE